MEEEERIAASPRGHELANARRDGFTVLYREHVTELYRFVHARCRDHEIAEDVTHDVFVTAVRTVEDPAEITVGWLKQVARNRMIDVLRRGARGRDKLRLLQSGTREIQTDTAVVDRLMLDNAMSRLSVEHRLVLTLHYLDGQTVPALAAELGRSVKSIEGLVTRANRKLRTELGDTDV